MIRTKRKFILGYSLCILYLQRNYVYKFYSRVSSNVEDSSDGAVIEMNNAEKKYGRAVQLATPSSPLNSAEIAHVSKPSEDTKRIGRSVNIKATTFDKHPKREWPWLKDEEENHPIGNVHRYVNGYISWKTNFY